MGRNMLCWVGLNSDPVPSPGVVLLDPDNDTSMVAASILAAASWSTASTEPLPEADDLLDMTPRGPADLLPPLLPPPPP